MARGKGFSSKPKTRKRTKLDPRSSVKLEKYLNQYFGKYWAEDCVFKVVDAPGQIILLLEVPIERHHFFTEERQQKLKQAALSFGFDLVKIKLSSLNKDVLRQFSGTLII